MCACLSDCGFVHVCAVLLRPEKTLGPSELELEENYLTWVLQLELGSSGRAARALWPLCGFH